MMIGAILGTIAIVLVVIVVGLLVDRKVTLVPRPEAPAPARPAATHLAGEAPATALQLRATQLGALRTSQRCETCKAAMHPEPDDSVRYDGADLLVLHFTCSGCGARRTRYVAVR